MMQQVRLYESPQEFAEMMIRHLSDSLQVHIQQVEGEPLLLEVAIDDNTNNGKLQVSLHNTFQTYKVTGDLNAAIDYLNGIIASAVGLRANKGMVKIDPSYIYPAIRERRYLDTVGNNMSIVSDEYLPGLSVIFLEIKDTYSKIISKELLKQHPRLTEEKVKQLAYHNLRSSGWTPSRMTMQSPFRASCYVEVYMDNPYPPECQFLLPEMSLTQMPSSSFLIAYTNRKTTVLLRSNERMDSLSEALRLAKKSRFKEVVNRSCRVMPNPVSDQIYWVNRREAKLLENV